MRISEEGINFIIRHEGLELEPYEDVAGKWTVGVGHLLRDDEERRTITTEESRELLRKDLASAELAVNKMVKVPVTQKEYDSLVSLTFNIGKQAFFTSSVLRFLNEQNYDDAAEAFLLWNKITKDGKKVMSQGLLNRRRAEMTLFLGGDYA
jgi:lysozyme